MCTCSRRAFCQSFAGSALALLAAAPAHALTDRDRFFVAEAARMRQQAIAAGDQPYGAVIVRNDEIIGYGPSRVILDRNPAAHAERVALWDAQRRTGTKALPGAVIYSTSIPCRVCQRALTGAGIATMRYGPMATDAGPPKAAD